MIAQLVLILLMLPIVIGPAQAQNGANVDTSPSLKVIGFYSFSTDKAAYARFIRERIDANDPPNFSENLKTFLREAGRGDEIRPLTAEDRQDWEDDLRRHMDDAAIFEVLVTNPDARFRIDDFLQADTSQPKEQWQVAWNETFLTADGETAIDIDHKRRLPELKQYRVVFVIHYWKPGLPLRSSYGELEPPPMQPLSERLWRLAPYELPS